MANITARQIISASHRKAIDSVLDAVSGPFRRSAFTNVLYPLTTPRSREVAERLAAKLLSELSNARRIQRHGHQRWIKVAQQRTLRSGRAVPELADTSGLTLTTRCPTKWLAVDLETGDVWAGHSDGWRRATAEECQEASACLS